MRSFVITLLISCLFLTDGVAYRQSQRNRIDLLLHADSESEARDALDALGCTPFVLAGLTRRSQLLTFLLLTTIAVCVAMWLGPKFDRRKLQFDVANLILGVGLLVAAWQWEAAVEQRAMEQYVKEIDSLNNVENAETLSGTDEATQVASKVTVSKNTAFDAIHAMMKHLYPKTHYDQQVDMAAIAKMHYVYIQLDNLEYAVERYRQGFASAYTTVRAVKTFQSRCGVGSSLGSPEFRARVKAQLSDSYPQVVRRVVSNLECDKE
jgi:hypothetical protein